MGQPATHYAISAKRLFLSGAAHQSVDSAIRSGARTEEEWCLLLRLCERRFWIANNQKARRAVKARHPMKAGKMRTAKKQTAAEISNQEALAYLKRKAQAIADMGGFSMAHINRQADALYLFYLDYLEAALDCPELPRNLLNWFPEASGMSRRTVWRRLKAGRARAAGIASESQKGLIAEQRRLELTPLPDEVY